MSSGSYSFQVGSFQCVALSDGRFNYPLNSFFANVPTEEVQAALRQRQLPVDHVTTPFTCLLVNTEDHLVLIDTGAGNLGAHASKLFPTVDHTTSITGTLVENMKTIGFHPDDIDIIIITHAHPDHVGGTFDASGELVFANAEYFIHLDEWTFWTSDAAEKASPAWVQIARNNLAPLESRLRYIEHEVEVVPGISTIPTPGHTPGHLVVSISSNGEKLLHIADVALYPLHLEHPTWFPLFDINPEQATASKRQVMDQAVAERAMIFAHHFPPFPNLGHAVQHGEAWRWQPLVIEG